MQQPDMLSLAVNAALNDARLARARNMLMNGGGHGLDTKRPQAWCEYGWPEFVEYSDLYGLYRRGGVAHGIVNKIKGTCWRTDPWVIQGDPDDESTAETRWEARTKEVLSARVWRSFADADRRRLVGRYAGLLLHIKDDRSWDQPVERQSVALERVTPAWAGALRVAEFNNDKDSSEFGKPIKWQYIEATQNGAPGRTLDVHPDRIFILGDWASDAIGFLEPGYNAFINLEKIEGGSGESFLKNAARQVSVNFDKEIDFRELARLYGVSVDELQERFNEAAREINRGNDQMLITQGASVSPLVANVPDPEPHYGINIQTIAASTDMPSKIVVGMQTGERASTEDQKYFNASCQSRRKDLSLEIEDFVDHLIRINVIDAQSGGITVMWDDLTEATQADKLGSAKTMGEINNTYASSGEPIFDTNEIRTAAGFEPRDSASSLPDADPDDDDMDDDG